MFFCLGWLRLAAREAWIECKPYRMLGILAPTALQRRARSPFHFETMPNFWHVQIRIFEIWLLLSYYGAMAGVTYKRRCCDSVIAWRRKLTIRNNRTVELNICWIMSINHDCSWIAVYNGNPLAVYSIMRFTSCIVSCRKWMLKWLSENSKKHDIIFLKLSLFITLWPDFCDTCSLST